MSTKSTNSGYLITRRYGDFKGLDCRDGEISLNRSPDTLNMWRNYKSSNMLETRPDIVLSTQFDNPVYGLFFYEVSNQIQTIVHSGTKLYKVLNSYITKSDNINEFYLLHDNFTTSITNSTYEWRYDGIGEVDKFYMVFDSNGMYEYVVRTRTVEGVITTNEYLFGYWEENNGKYKYEKHINKVPDDIKDDKDLSYYGERYIDFNHNLSARNIPEYTLPNIMKNYTKTDITPTGINLKPAKSYFFIHNNILYFKDGLNYLRYNGTTAKNIVDDDDTYIPRTTIGKSPSGGGTSFQYANTLTKYRRNDFTADGQSLVYQLDATNISGVKSVYVNDTLYSYVASDPGENEYTVDTTAGTIIFGVAPDSPNTDGQDNVFITYSKVESANTDAILKCTLLAEFDNKIFFSGNQDYPNAIWYSGGVGAADDVTYVPFNQFYNEGLDNSPVRALVPGNNALWVFKEPSQANTTVFYHIPTTVYENGISINTYPSVHSSISTGCIATGLNFADDIVFYSDRGLEGITGDVTTEQLLAHRSTFVDNKLLKEINYYYRLSLSRRVRELYRKSSIIY